VASLSMRTKLGGPYPHLPAASAIGASAAASADSVKRMVIERVFTALSFRFPDCPAQSDVEQRPLSGYCSATAPLTTFGAFGERS
jgi:hypothetical protein